MHVTYTPPLLDQIRAQRRREEIVVIRHPSGFVQRVDPETRDVTGEPQQFVLRADGTLTILPKYEWIAAPTIVEVDTVRYG